MTLSGASEKCPYSLIMTLSGASEKCPYSLIMTLSGASEKCPYSLIMEPGHAKRALMMIFVKMSLVSNIIAEAVRIAVQKTVLKNVNPNQSYSDFCNLRFKVFSE